MGQRTTVSTRLDKDLVKSIKYLAVDLERRMNDILEEAIRDILKKYRKSPPRGQVNGNK